MEFVVIATSFVVGGVVGSLFVRFWMNKEIEMVHNQNVELKKIERKGTLLAIDLSNADEKIARLERKLREEKDEISRLKRDNQQMHIPRPSVRHWTERDYQAGA